MPNRNCGRFGVGLVLPDVQACPLSRVWFTCSHNRQLIVVCITANTQSQLLVWIVLNAEYPQLLEKFVALLERCNNIIYNTRFWLVMQHIVVVYCIVHDPAVTNIV